MVLKSFYFGDAANIDPIQTVVYADIENICMHYFHSNMQRWWSAAAAHLAQLFVMFRQCCYQKKLAVMLLDICQLFIF